MATKKPSRIFTSLDDLYNWMQGIFKSQTKKGSAFSKDKVIATYDIRIISEPDSSDWEEILHCDNCEDFREVISEQVDIWKPAAIGVVINYDSKQPFCACRLLTEHIDVLDGKRKPEVISTPRQMSGFSLNGLGESGLGALADLREQNTCTRYEAQIANLNTEHKHDLEMKARDLRDLKEKYDKLEKENSDLKSQVAALEEEKGNLQDELDEANEAASANTQSMLMGLASTFLANKGYNVEGLNGYLASRQGQPVAELPQVAVESEETDEPDGRELSDGERKDAEIVMNWLRSLPQITRIEMIEVMKRVEANPILSRKLLNYIDHLYEKSRQHKQIQQPKQNPVAVQQNEQPQDNEEENSNVFEEEDGKYGAI